MQIYPICIHCNKPKEKHYHDKLRNTHQCMFGMVIGVICRFEPMKITKIHECEQKPRPSGCYTEYLTTSDGRSYYLLHCKDTVYRIIVPPKEEDKTSKYSTNSK